MRFLFIYCHQRGPHLYVEVQRGNVSLAYMRWITDLGKYTFVALINPALSPSPSLRPLPLLAAKQKQPNNSLHRMYIGESLTMCRGEGEVLRPWKEML